MRIYLPATAADLARPDGVDARKAHAVTPALRAAFAQESEEELELAAFLVAAQSSLASLSASDVPRRVVIAAEVDEAQPTTGEDLTEVTAPAVPWPAVVSIHVDDPDDGDAAQVVSAAVGGDDAAIGAAEELDLLWFDATERDLLRDLL